MKQIRKAIIFPRQVDMDLLCSVPLRSVVVSSLGDVAGIDPDGGLYVVSSSFRVSQSFVLPERPRDLFWVGCTSILAAVLSNIVRLVRVLTDTIEFQDVSLRSLPPINKNTLVFAAKGESSHYALPFRLTVRNVPENERYLADSVVVHYGEDESATWIRFVGQEHPVLAFAWSVGAISASISGNVIKVDNLLWIRDVQEWYELPEGIGETDQSPFPDIGFTCSFSSCVVQVSRGVGVWGYRIPTESLGHCRFGLLPDGHLIVAGEKGILVSRSPVVL